MPLSFATDLEVTPFVSPDSLPLSCADITVSGGVLGLMGHDAIGNDSQLWRFYGLDSGKTLKLNIVDRCHTIPDGCTPELRLALVDFSEEPPSVLERHDGLGLAMEFTCPEDGFTIRGVALTRL